MEKLRWGILGTGQMGRQLAGILQGTSAHTLQAVASRDVTKAQALAEKSGCPRAYGRYEDLLADPKVDAVYIATPHPQHAEWTIRAAQAGKHILCEKPAAMSHAETSAMIASAQENDVFFLEGFVYRCHPQTARVVELIRAGEVGEVRLIKCSLGFIAPVDLTSRLWARKLGGGAILDVGCYCMSMARLLAGAAQGLPFANPNEIKAVGELHPEEKTDVSTSAVLRFPGGITGELSISMNFMQESVQVFGSKGRLTVISPWLSNKEELIILRSNQGEERAISIDFSRNVWLYELDMISQYLDQRQTPAMTWNDTLGNALALDQWRREIGLTYDSDQD